MQCDRAWIIALVCAAFGLASPASASAGRAGPAEARSTAEIELRVDLLDDAAEPAATESVRARLLEHLSTQGIVVQDEGEVSIAFDVIEQAADGSPSFVVRGRARRGQGEPVAIRAQCNDCSSRALVDALVNAVDEAIATAPRAESAVPAGSIAPTALAAPPDAPRTIARKRDRSASERGRYLPNELGAGGLALIGSGTVIGIVGASLWGATVPRPRDESRNMAWTGAGLVGFSAVSILIGISMTAVDVHRHRRGHVTARGTVSRQGGAVVLVGRF